MKLRKFIDTAEEVFCGIGFLFTAILIFVNVILRYLFNTGIPWTEEAVRYIIIWMSLIGMSICARNDGHARIDFLMEYLNAEWRVRLSYLGIAVGLIFSILLFVYGIKVTYGIFLSKQITAALSMPMWIPYACVPLGGLLTSIRYGQLAIGIVTTARDRGEGL